MSAKEMFEKLGWKYDEELSDNNTIVYLEEIDDGYFYYRLEFFTFTKTISIDTYITPNLLQAINKQVEELGWNNGRKRKDR